MITLDDSSCDCNSPLMAQQYRIRDPIHGLILFDEDETDILAWKLIQTPEFQRLRRIKQLGLSELTFPGATHTRFSHSIGVFHNARKLMKIVERAEGKSFNKERAGVVLLAALLHDIGHGPFSHAFENARKTLSAQRSGPEPVKHEMLTAEIILNTNGKINEILGSLANPIGALFRADDPQDIYHAVVSSSFDADRLDYLIRDRYMTGCEAGSIDTDWLMDNLETDHIDIRQDDDEESQSVATFVFKEKARQAAEDFLLARYRLYTQVYLHKTTRGFEQALSALIARVGAHADKPKFLNLPGTNPLLAFLRSGELKIEKYLNLDDTVIWATIEQLRYAKDETTKTLALRLWNRIPLKVLDVTDEMGHDIASKGSEASVLRDACKRVEDLIKSSIGLSAFRDDAKYNLYSEIKSDTAKEHKKLRIRTNGKHMEICSFPDTVISESLMRIQTRTRFYFLTSEERDGAQKAMRGR